MLIEKRVTAVPLITCDPYFSLWSDADELTEKDTVHWTGRTQALRGVANVDGRAFRFLGLGEEERAVQRSLDITPTSTTYCFEAAGALLRVRFTTPLLLEDPALVSRPVSYLDFSAESLDGAVHRLTVTVTADENHCHTTDEPCEMAEGVFHRSAFHAAWMGKSAQTPLGHSADLITIDWGYFYLAAPAKNGRARSENAARCRVEAQVNLSTEDKGGTFLMAAYDDISSINYFGFTARGYWTKGGRTILDALTAAAEEHDDLLARCDRLDESILRRAEELAGRDYALLCALAYRQSVAAHKLIADENGEMVFLPKENNSNGCIGTVDVCYPSSPLYLLYNTELIKGMLRPIFKFAAMPVWHYDFAPHDIGRYPYATGQVYASRLCYSGDAKPRYQHGAVFPPSYIMGAEDDVFDERYQMPVEECGNMLILCAAVSRLDGDAAFAAQYLETLRTWAEYLLRNGEMPENQLCTDDFAGHLANNANLAAKAVMGVAAFGEILRMLGRADEAAQYARKAREMARSWEERAGELDHTRLAFDAAGSWSLKYNAVWDLFFGTRLFSEDFFRKEIQWYLDRSNAYGVPLDSRKDYTKSDWILWCAAFAESRSAREALIAPVGRYVRESAGRVPFADWYDTVTADYYIMRARSVQGGVFMPLLIERERGR